MSIFFSREVSIASTPGFPTWATVAHVSGLAEIRPIVWKTSEPSQEKKEQGGKNANVNSAEPPGPREQGRRRSFVPTRALRSLCPARQAPPYACVVASILRSGPGVGGSRSCALATSEEGRGAGEAGEGRGAHARGSARLGGPLGRRGGSDAEGGAVRRAGELCGAGRCRGGGGGGGGGWGLTRPGSWGSACLFIYF